jgi:hypothetical protein
MPGHADDRAGLRKDGLMLSFDDFAQLRQEICASAPASGGDDLPSLEIGLCVFLGDHAPASGGLMPLESCRA